MNTVGHPVRWRGQTLYLSDRTDRVKFAYCSWVANRTLDNARKVLRADLYYEFERRVMAHLPQWTSVPDGAVVASFQEPDAMRQLVRLHLDAAEDELPDAELDALIAEKSADPDSDYSRALKLIGETADPKASGASSGSRAPTVASEPTPSSAGSPTST